ncbi:MAG: hypothetical protein IJZ77_03065 [Bacilli bacterium]|nr:hypothetical protein [Bacilli bacterium]
MSIKINFDSANNPETPTFILTKRNGDRIGLIEQNTISLSDVLKDASEISFTVNKYTSSKRCHVWDEIVDFNLIYCVEWDMYFEITVEIEESTEIKKTVYCKSLGHAELSQIKIYGIEINTENDIARDDYEVTIMYNPDNPKGSLLHRIMEKAPHYSIIHVDNTIKNIQRMFTFDNISIYDAFQEIAEEIGCIFILHSNSDKFGKIQRTISVYDLQSYCNDCGHRGDFIDVCPECQSKNISNGYGEDTTIFVTSDELANELKLSTDTDATKNCFKLEAGDDLMTATIRSCNPNGSDYIWHISEEIKKQMSSELVDKINKYDAEYEKYQKNSIILSNSLISEYNKLVNKYRKFNDTLSIIESPVEGYQDLINVYYNTIDFNLYLQTSLMPTILMSETSAKSESLKCTKDSLSPVSVADIKNISLSTANNAVLAIAKIIIDTRYQVKINQSSFDKETKVWTGNFSIINYSDEEDMAVSPTVEIEINNNYEIYVKQKIDKSLQKDEVEDIGIVSLFKKGLEELTTNQSLENFKNVELGKYSLDYLSILEKSCQGCIDILIEQGASNNTSTTWTDLYESLYLPYYNMLCAISEESDIRESEISIILRLQESVNNTKVNIQNQLNFEKYLGEELWLEFCSFRREDKYSNSNYISDGLNNAELIIRANEFIKTAQNEIYKSSELQHKIESTLKNLLVIKKFSKLVNYFKVGNWLRVMINDEIYKLRLVKYTIDFDDLNNISVEFSDVAKATSSTKSIKEIIEQAKSMASSYDSVKRQASQGSESNSVLNDWTVNGLNTTNIKIIGGANNQTQTWDENGMLFREYDSIQESYSNEQIKIINSTIAMSDDNWNSAKSAFGKFYYYDPVSRTIKIGFGINGEMLVGKILIGQELGIYNKDGTLTFNEYGFKVFNDKNEVIINPNNAESIFSITNNNNKIFSFSEDGDLVILGNITAKQLTLLDGAEVPYQKVSGLHKVASTGQYDSLEGKPELKKVAVTGEYEDLFNKPDLSGIEENQKDIQNIYNRLDSVVAKFG